MVDRGEEHQARSYLNTVVAGAESELDDLSQELEAVQKEQSDRRPQKEKLLGYVDT